MMTCEQAFALSFFMVITRYSLEAVPYRTLLGLLGTGPTRYAPDVAYFAYLRLQHKAGVQKVF